MTHSGGTEHTHKEHSTLIGCTTHPCREQHSPAYQRTGRTPWDLPAHCWAEDTKEESCSVACSPSPSWGSGKWFLLPAPQASRAGRGSRQQVAWKRPLANRGSSGPLSLQGPKATTVSNMRLLRLPLGLRVEQLAPVNLAFLNFFPVQSYTARTFYRGLGPSAHPGD